MWLSELEALRPLFDEWNAANKRARREHEEHPIVTCLGIIRTDGEAVPCWNLRVHGDLCRGCANERELGRQRWAAWREARA